MNVQFESQLQGIIARLAPRFREDHKRKIAALRTAGGTSYDGMLAIVQATGHTLDVRLTAIWALGRLSDKSAVPALLTALADVHPDIRRYAAIALGELRDRRATSPLIWTLQKDTDTRVRKAAAYALRWLGDAAAIDPLVHALQNGHEDVAVRGTAAESLGEMGAHQALSPLIAALQDPSVEVRFWSAFALGALGDARALPALERVAATDHAVVPNWMHLPSRGLIKDEARDAIARIRA